MTDTSDISGEDELSYHLFVDPQELPVAAQALRLLISDEAHEPEIRRLAREVIAQLTPDSDARATVTVTLSPPEMKITHTALHLLFDDLQREQSAEREILRGLLDKLPDEHSIRAIALE
jgi:hypothetical protein